MQRRQYLAGMTGLLASPLLKAQAAEPEFFTITGVLALSGPFGIVGETVRRGADLAIEMRGKVLGKPIRVTWDDDETNAQLAVQKVSRRISAGTNLLFGSVSSSSTLAMKSIAEARKIPLLTTTSSDDVITSPKGTHYTFRTSNRYNMESRMVSAFAKEKGLKKIYAVVTDYQAPREFWEQFKAGIAGSGTEIVGIDFVPLGTTDFSIIFDKIIKTDADSAGLFVFGNDAVTALKQAGQVALGEKRVLFGPGLVDEQYAAAAGNAALGVYAVIRYHWSYQFPENDAFVKAFRAKYDAWPSPYAGQAYDGLTWFMDVIEDTGSWDTDKWVTAMATSTRTNSIEGVKVMRSCDHQAAHDGYWGKIVEGQAPYPALMMSVTNVFKAATLFDPC